MAPQGRIFWNFLFVLPGRGARKGGGRGSSDTRSFTRRAGEREGRRTCRVTTLPSCSCRVTVTPPCILCRGAACRVTTLPSCSCRVTVTPPCILCRGAACRVIIFSFCLCRVIVFFFMNFMSNNCRFLFFSRIFFFFFKFQRDFLIYVQFHVEHRKSFSFLQKLYRIVAKNIVDLSK